MTPDEFKRAAKTSVKQRLENKFLESFALVKPHGTPMPVREHRFHPVRKWRFDFAWPQIKLAVEINGGGFTLGGHNRGVHQASDFEKLNEAMRLGWTVLQFGTLQMKDPAACAAYVADAMVSIGQRSLTAAHPQERA
jgi:very-short-patch-repair endonuclease